MGETDDEIDGLLADLAAIGVDIVTIGQYLRPTSHHLPVARWVEPDEFDALEGGRRGARHRPRRGQPAHPRRATTPSLLQIGHCQGQPSWAAVRHRDTPGGIPIPHGV